jgi:hypothetical protein
MRALAFPRSLPLVFAGSLSLAGCLSHERSDPADAGALGDAPSLPDAATAPDAASVDAAARTDAPRSCGPDDRWVTVRVEPVTSEVANCAPTRIEGADLRAITPVPEEDGIRLHFDFCPTADADCRCDVVLTNVGSDVAAQLAPLYPVDVEVHAGEEPMSMPYLSVRKTPMCECEGCGCSLPLYLHAGSSMPSAAAALPPGMSFSVGASVCAAEDCLFGGSSDLHVTTEGGEGDVHGGETQDLGGTRVRSVRDVEILAPCAACAGCASPYGAWIAWAE